MIEHIKRMSKDEYFLRMASLVSNRATCLRRRVGCVLVSREGHILATGYNGRPSKWPHCNHRAEDATLCDPTEIYLHACHGAFSASGVGLDDCEAIHAEQNALLQCYDMFRINACYVTDSPCVTCTKLLLNTTCERVVFINQYPHAASAKLWLKECGRSWLELKLNDAGKNSAEALRYDDG